MKYYRVVSVDPCDSLDDHIDTSRRSIFVKTRLYQELMAKAGAAGIALPNQTNIALEMWLRAEAALEALSVPKCKRHPRRFMKPSHNRTRWLCPAPNCIEWRPINIVIETPD